MKDTLAAILVFLLCCCISVPQAFGQASEVPTDISFSFPLIGPDGIGSLEMEFDEDGNGTLTFHFPVAVNLSAKARKVYATNEPGAFGKKNKVFLDSATCSDEFTCTMTLTPAKVLEVDAKLDMEDGAGFEIWKYFAFIEDPNSDLDDFGEIVCDYYDYPPFDDFPPPPPLDDPFAPPPSPSPPASPTPPQTYEQKRKMNITYTKNPKELSIYLYSTSEEDGWDPQKKVRFCQHEPQKGYVEVASVYVRKTGATDEQVYGKNYTQDPEWKEKVDTDPDYSYTKKSERLGAGTGDLSVTASSRTFGIIHQTQNTKTVSNTTKDNKKKKRARKRKKRKNSSRGARIESSNSSLLAAKRKRKKKPKQRVQEFLTFDPASLVESDDALGGANATCDPMVDPYCEPPCDPMTDPYCQPPCDPMTDPYCLPTGCSETDPWCDPNWSPGEDDPFYDPQNEVIYVTQDSCKNVPEAALGDIICFPPGVLPPSDGSGPRCARMEDPDDPNGPNRGDFCVHEIIIPGTNGDETYYDGSLFVSLLTGEYDICFNDVKTGETVVTQGDEFGFYWGDKLFTNDPFLQNDPYFVYWPDVDDVEKVSVTTKGGDCVSDALIVGTMPADEE